jgi:hypothetical protein
MSIFKKTLDKTGDSVDKKDPKEFSSELSVAFLVKVALRAAIKESGLSREVIADQMNLILGSMEMRGLVTVDQINSWTKNQEDRVIPLVLLPVFCKVTDSVFPFQVLLQPLGAKIMSVKDEVYLELGKAHAMKRAALKKEHDALERLGLNGNESVVPPDGSWED